MLYVLKLISIASEVGGILSIDTTILLILNR
jgi:hypothetical protein